MRTTARSLLPDLALLLGAALVLHALLLVWPPAAYLVSGLMLIGAGIGFSPRSPRRKPQ